MFRAAAFPGIQSFLILLKLFAVNAHPDEIIDLPGSELLEVNFKQYSGYLEGSTTARFHFYWFMESQNDPKNDPLIFWFNGGPGCSSLQGNLAEFGPFRVKEDGETLEFNNNSWNEMASIVFLESPAQSGLGFSYSLDEINIYNDTMSAESNYAAFKNFFKKFPEYNQHTVFIMGESYGAVYTSMLLERIIDGMDEFPVKIGGLVIVSGYVDDQLIHSYRVQTAFGFGSLSEELLEHMLKCCKTNCTLKCFEQDPAISETCATETFVLILARYNTYDIFRKCYEDEDAPIICIDSRPVIKYLDSATTRSALHVYENASRSWYACNQIIDYNHTFINLVPQMKKIFDANIRILMMYGDTDTVCPAVFGEIFSARLGRKKIAKKQPWFYDGRLSGFKTEYESLTFLTVRGTGHMVPEWEPEKAHFAIKRFLNNEPINDDSELENSEMLNGQDRRGNEQQARRERENQARRNREERERRGHDEWERGDRENGERRERELQARIERSRQEMWERDERERRQQEEQARRERENQDRREREQALREFLARDERRRLAEGNRRRLEQNARRADLFRFMEEEMPEDERQQMDWDNRRKG